MLKTNVPPISESTENRILDSISQDEQDTHETQSEASFDSDDTQSDIPPFIWGSRASNYFILNAWHNSGMKVEIVFRATRTQNCSIGQLSPVAKFRKVIASFKPGSKDFLHNVSFFWIRVPTLFSSSLNISGCIRRKLKNECTFSILNSAKSRSYWPYCSLLSAESQRRAHMDLHCFCLLLRLRTTRNTACASIMACCPWSNKTCCNSLLSI